MSETAEAVGLRLKSARGRWVVTATVLGSGMAALDATVVGIALPAIGRNFHAGVASLQWVVDAYTLTLAGLLLLGGTLGDSYGRRKLFMIGIVWFAARVAAVRAGPDRGGADRGPGPAGGRRGAADPRQPGHPAGVLRPGRPLGRHRRVVRTWRRGHRDRAVPRRVADRRGVLAAGVLHQPAAGRAGPGHLRPARARDQVARSGAEAGRQGGRVHQRRAGRDHLRADRGLLLRLGFGGGAGTAGGGGGPARPVHLGRGQRAGAHAAARGVPVAAVLRGQRGDVRRVRGAGRAAVPGPGRAPGGPRLQPDRGGHGPAAGDVHHAGAVVPVGRAGGQDRAPAADVGRARWSSPRRSCCSPGSGVPATT